MEKNIEIKLQVLICTYGEGGIKRVAEHHLPEVPGVEYLISWQLPEGAPEIPITLRREDIKVSVINSRGLSKNRNHALSIASAPYCLIADDDLDFNEEGLRGIIRNFEENPELDIAIYQCEGTNKTYPASGFDLKHFPKGYYVSSVEIAFRRESVLSKGINFDERFGVGGLFIFGEEEIWISQLLKRGLRGYYFPIVVSTHKGESSGTRMLNDSRSVEAKGAVMSLTHPHTWMLRMCAHAMPGRRPEGFTLSQYVGCWLRGRNLCRKTSKMETEQKSANIALLFWVISVMLLFCQIVTFNYLAEIARFNTFTNLLVALSDAMLILSPFLLLKGLWRRTIIIPMILVPAFLYANLLYFRDFHDVMGLQTMFGVENANGEVMGAAFSSVILPDLGIGLPLLLFLILYCIFFKRMAQGGFSGLFKIYAFVIILGVFASSQARLAYLVSKDYSPEKCNPKIPQVSEPLLYNKFKESPRKYRLSYYSLTPYLFRELYDYLKPEYRKPTPEEVAQINEFVNLPVSPLLAEIDSLPDNSGKNLILIVVESFDSDLLYVKPGGKLALPNLWRIIEEADSKIFLDNIVPQIGQGRSSDGRFVYQTGIIPNPTSPVAMNHPVAYYPSLARAYNGNAKEFDVGAPLQWNKIPMSKSYGYQKIHTETDLRKNMKSLGGRDAALFENALPLIKEMKQPFLATLCTMDMHDPYDTFGWKPSDAWEDKSFTPQERVYIEKGRQFDNAFAKFIEGLKECGLYDNSVIAIVSDHTARENRLNGSHFNHPRIPAIILNSGINLKSNEEKKQCDIYPTLLDVTGRGDYTWRGFGNSVVREPRKVDIPLEHLAITMLDTGYWK